MSCGLQSLYFNISPKRNGKYLAMDGMYWPRLGLGHYLNVRTTNFMPGLEREVFLKIQRCTHRSWIKREQEDKLVIVAISRDFQGRHSFLSGKRLFSSYFMKLELDC